MPMLGLWFGNPAIMLRKSCNNASLNVLFLILSGISVDLEDRCAKNLIPGQRDQIRVSKSHSKRGTKLEKWTVIPKIFDCDKLSVLIFEWANFEFSENESVKELLQVNLTEFENIRDLIIIHLHQKRKTLEKYSETLI